MKHLLMTLLCLSAAGLARADVKLPAIFGDHMVLQRDVGVPVWGWASPGEGVTVAAGGDKASTTAGADGRWSVKLGKLQASSHPIEVVVAGKNTITLHDVLVGDVWVCSGQSNMEFGIRAFMPVPEFLKINEPQIRLFSVPRVVAAAPASDIGQDFQPQLVCPLRGSWQVCTADALTRSAAWSGFSATGYYFGHALQQFTGQPVGLIQSSVGGTRINAWTSLAALKTSPMMAGLAKSAQNFQDNFPEIEKTYKTVTKPKYDAELAKWKADNKAELDAYDADSKSWHERAKAAQAAGQPVPPRPRTPKPPREPGDPMTSPGTTCGLFNGMIAPLIPYGIKGVIWYQGESNGDQPVFYRTALPLLVNDWRKLWGQGDFPFLVVQLPNFMPRRAEPAESDWAGVREAQAKVLDLPNTGYAVTIDIGDGGNIHPGDKLDVGTRLALVARHVAYGWAGVYSGPTYKSSAVEGGKIRIAFDNTGGGLALGTAPDNYYACQRPPLKKPAAPTKLEGFAIAGADHKYVWADAVIDGGTVIVSNPAVPNPVSVRYAWANNPACNLYNQEGLPAAPFRTDDLPLQK